MNLRDKARTYIIDNSTPILHAGSLGLLVIPCTCLKTKGEP